MGLNNKIKKRVLKQFRFQTQQVYPGIFRPHSKPFISGDTFRNHCDHIFDETTTLNPEKVESNDIVFLKTDLIDIYFNYYHPKIQNKYILITHNSDQSVGELEYSHKDEKIIHWFATNLVITANETVSPLPIGLENKRYLSYGRIKNFEAVSKSTTNKKNKVACSFNIHTNPLVRKEILEDVKKIDFISTFNADTQFNYLKELNEYSFNLCPEGNGVETHRVWESLLLDVIPICVSNTNSLNYSALGVPMILINNWNDLQDCKLDFLLESKKKFSTYDPLKYSQFKFWWELILEKKL